MPIIIWLRVKLLCVLGAAACRFCVVAFFDCLYLSMLFYVVSIGSWYALNTAFDIVNSKIFKNDGNIGSVFTMSKCFVILFTI